MRFLEKVIEESKKVRKKGSFLRNLTFTFSGNLLLFIVNLVFYPIITRLFTPSAYGEYALFLMLFNNLTIVSNLGYNDSLVVEESRKNYYTLSASIFYLSLIGSIIVLVVLLPFYDYIKVEFALNETISSWIVIAFPLAILEILKGTISMGNVRFGYLERSAKVSVIVRIGSKFIVILCGVLGLQSGLGLVLGDTTILIAMILFSLPWKDLKNILSEILNFKKAEGIQLLKKYIDYPKFVFPTLWVVVIVQQIPLWFIGYNYGKQSLGLYTFCWGILGVSIGLLIKSIQPVFFHKNLKIKDLDSSDVRNKIQKFVNVQLVALALFYFFGIIGIELFYEYLFEERWHGGQELMRLIIVGSGAMILGSPMASIFKVKGKIRTDFIYRLVMAGSLIILSFVLYIIDINFYNYSLIYNCSFFILFFIFYLMQLREYHFSRIQLIRIIFQVLFVLSIFFLTNDFF